MFLKRLLKGAVITGMAMLLLFVAMGRDAGAESYSLTDQISGLNAPLGVAVGPDGRVYIADQSNYLVVQFDEYGSLINQCSFQSSGYLPLALAVAPDGQIYYVTRYGNGSNGDIIRFASPDSCDFTEVGSPSQGIIYEGAAVAPDGSVFVSDFVNDKILKFGPDGTLVKSWGTRGNSDPVTCESAGLSCGPEFNYPKGMAVFGGSILLVADTGNNRIQAFDLDGNFLLATGPQLNSPQNVAVGPDGNIYILDTASNGNIQVEKYASDGTLLAQFGSEILSKPDALFGGLAVDRGENVYVVDSDNSRVAVFTPDIVTINASANIITGNAPLSLFVNLGPDKYWEENTQAFEVFLWAEGPGVKAYLTSIPLHSSFDNLKFFSSLSEMKPILEQQTGMPALNNYRVDIIDNSSPVPAGTYTLHLCLDRDVNGVFNPSASVCGTISIVRQ